MAIYDIGAFTESELLAQGTAGNNIGKGDNFVMPATTTVTIEVTDNDNNMSGDNWNNENANDQTGQTATVIENGVVTSQGHQIYAECYFWVKDQFGNWYIMIEMELENQSGDYFTFYRNVPPEGAQLTIHCKKNVKGCWVKYDKLMEPDSVQPPLAEDDMATISETEIAVLNVLDNDMDVEGDAIAVTAVEGGALDQPIPMTTPEGYSVLVTLSADGALVVVPGPEVEQLKLGETTTVSFEYTITDSEGLIDTATVTIEITGKTTLVAADDAVIVTEDEGAGDAEGNVLDNDTIDGVAYDGAVTAVNGEADGVGTWVEGSNGGRVKINADGSYDFDADGDFAHLNDGDSAQTSFDYQISSSGKVTSAQKQNVLFVIDVSGSTSPAQFAGGAVGDLNGDGHANTVLDAQIASYQALNAQIAGMGLDPAMVDIGLVCFSGSGVGTSGSITGDATIVGTYKPGDAALDTALSGLTDGGSTNFEAALFDANDWFAQQNALPDDNNVVFFLSDGMNNTGNSFADEVASLSTDYDASMVAVGVGNDADLSELNQIDNTGGAQIVTTTDALTTELLDGLSQVIDITDTGTLTVTVLGQDDDVIVANDDAITVCETESHADTDGNVLINDTHNDGAYAGNVVAVSGDAANVGVWIDLAQGGRVKLNTDGSFDFDAGGDFDHLANGETGQVSFTYDIEVPGGQSETITEVDFNAYGAGVVITDQIAGVSVSSSDPGKPPMIFDTANPTGGDFDLAHPTAGKVMIISEDGDSSDPDDNAGVASLYFDFDVPSRLTSLTVLDTEESGFLHFFDASGALIQTIQMPHTADGELAVMAFDVDGVARLEVNFCGSGAIDDLVFTQTVTEPPLTDTATVTVTIVGKTEYVAVADTMTVFASEAAGDTDLLDNGADNVLANDLEDGGAYTGDVLEVLFNAALVGQTVMGSNGGLMVINADGTLDFDANGDFSHLIDGQSDVTQFFYTIEDGQTASVTVTVLGETVRQAFDDIMTVSESEAAGDFDLLDSGAPSVLANDTENGGAYTGVVGSVNGSIGNVNSFVAGDNGGLLKINADGTMDFDANGDFDLADGVTVQTSFTYTLVSGEEATVTVNVVGEPDHVANDDVITVTESEGAGDLETLDSGAGSVLANDTTDGAAYGGDVTAVNGDTADIGQIVAGSNGGLATIYADGSIDFDANGEFATLNDGETAQTSFEYTITGGDTATVTINVLGEGDGGSGDPVINLAIMINSALSMYEQADTAAYSLPPYQDWNQNGVTNEVMDMAFLMVSDFAQEAFAAATTAGYALNLSLITFDDLGTGEGAEYFTIANEASADAQLNAKIAADNSADYGQGFANADAWFDSVASAGDTNAVFFIGNGFSSTAWDTEFAALKADHGVSVDAYLPDAVFSGTGFDALGLMDDDGFADSVYLDDEATATSFGVLAGQTALDLDTII